MITLNSTTKLTLLICVRNYDSSCSVLLCVEEKKKKD